MAVPACASASAAAVGVLLDSLSVLRCTWDLDEREDRDVERDRLDLQLRNIPRPDGFTFPDGKDAT